MFSKWLYSPGQSTESVQSLSNYQWHFQQKEKKLFKKILRKQKKKRREKETLREKKKKKKRARESAPWLPNLLQSYSHQNSMVLEFSYGTGI